MNWKRNIKLQVCGYWFSAVSAKAQLFPLDAQHFYSCMASEVIWSVHSVAFVCMYVCMCVLYVSLTCRTGNFFCCYCWMWSQQSPLLLFWCAMLTRWAKCCNFFLSLTFILLLLLVTVIIMLSINNNKVVVNKWLWCVNIYLHSSVFIGYDVGLAVLRKSCGAYMFFT